MTASEVGAAVVKSKKKIRQEVSMIFFSEESNIHIHKLFNVSTLLFIISWFAQNSCQESKNIDLETNISSVHLSPELLSSTRHRRSKSDKVEVN